MPRYFTHIFHGTWFLDDEGDEYPDLVTAIEGARRVAREIGEDPDAIDGTQVRVELADEHGRTVHVAHFQPR